jgi:fluoroacetyl-CoA thioesterase
MIAWCEAATVAAISAELEDGSTSVGTSVHVEHLAPTRVGADVSATAKLETVAGRSLTFGVTVREGDKVIATGTIARAIVNVERFLS